MPKHPEFIKAVKAELADWRLWSDRAVVLMFAVLAGLSVVGFTWLCERALSAFFDLQSGHLWLALLVTPLLTVVIVWLTRNYFPSAAGSGIPQVIAALSAQTPSAERTLFVSLKLSVAKVFLTAGGLLGGLSLGLQGPAVQIASGVMYSARRWLSKTSQVNDTGLLLAGGAAGIAAAFNTPLGGVMFAIEELSRQPEERRSGLLLSAIILAGLIAVSINGSASYFGVIHVDQISWNLLGPGLVVAIASGLIGGGFSRLLIYSIDPRSGGWLQGFRRRAPYKFAASCGLLVALVGVMTGGDTFGSGYQHTRELLSNQPETTQFYVFWKALVTWLTTWAGVPAGLFAPSLAIGGALGSEVSGLMQYPNAPTMIALGMAAFLAAVTQAPLTSFIIVMEMISGQQMVLSLMTSALIASGISRLITRPLFPTLAQMQLERLRGLASGSAPVAPESFVVSPTRSNLNPAQAENSASNPSSASRGQ